METITFFISTIVFSFTCTSSFSYLTSLWALTFRKTESSRFTTASLAIMIKDLMTNKVMETTSDSVILIVSMIKSWLRFLFFVWKHNINLCFTLRYWTFIYEVLNFRFVKFMLKFFIELIFLYKVEKYIFTWYPTTDLTFFDLFCWLISNPYT